MRLALSLFALVFVAGCTGTAEDTPTPEAPSREEGSPSDTPPRDATPGLSLDELLDSQVDGTTLQTRLNAPQRIETEPVANRHVEGQVDTLRTYVYDGIHIQFYDVTGSGVLLQEVDVTGEGYATADGLGVGSSRAAIEAAYPHVLEAEGSTITYEREDAEPTPTVLRVIYDGDRASSLTWVLYVD